MDWTALIGGITGPVFGLIDQAWYTEQEQAADQIARDHAKAISDQADAQRQAAALGFQGAQLQAKTLQTVAFVGAGVVGLGLVVWATKA